MGKKQFFKENYSEWVTTLLGTLVTKEKRTLNQWKRKLKKSIPEGNSVSIKSQINYSQ